MPTFGVSAFLKLVSLNAKPRKTELRRRLRGSSSGGYDFHRSLKLASHRYLVDGVSLEDLLEAAKDVAQLPERKSLIAGLERLALWRKGAPGQLRNVPPRVWESPKGFFKIAVQPEFGLINEGRLTAFHLWNTKTTDLDEDAAYAVLALLPELYRDMDDAPTDFGILSLHEPRALLLSQRPAASSSWLVQGVEACIIEIYNEAGGPPQPTPPGSHPPP